jgi:hypothetical protein
MIACIPSNTIMNILRYFFIFAAAAAFAAEPTPPEKYEVLIGEELSGSGFVIKYGSGFLGIASLHQFEGKAPRTLEPLEGAEVVLDTTKVIKQKDVQALPVKTPSPKMQFLAYKHDFALRTGDEVIILGPAGDCVDGVLTAKGMTGGAYKSADGPRELEARLNKPIMMAGGSGGPILHKQSGTVIGVLLTADDGDKARIVGFETLCLPQPK